MRPEKRIIVACTGSVATIKLSLLIQKLQSEDLPFDFKIKVITTENAKHFFDEKEIPNDVPIIDDSQEWQAWTNRGDPVVHIDLGKWADCMVIAPLSANSLAKIATGICDNLLLCVVRAWDLEKPLFFCPAMNTRMYDHPLTQEHIGKLKSFGYKEIPSTSKKLMCGDIGNGAMAEVQTIIESIVNFL